MREEEEFLAETAETAEEINLNNQINLSETHIPFCGICAICERIGGFSQKPQKSQKKIINLINQINLSETHIPFCAICAICERPMRCVMRAYCNTPLLVRGEKNKIGHCL